MEQNFIDQIKLFLASGNGGAGASHFRREKFVPKGGPDGGDGGRGGHIIIKGNENLWTLLHFKWRKHIKAEHGKPGSGQRSSGASGQDIVLEVPLGTIISDQETGEKLLEITEHNEEKILIEGGMGGLGNWNFKSATNQAPTYAQPGIEGKEGWFVFELKLLADVGLVGFPNAGKSTLLSSITAAKPKVASYAFTTLKPNLGIVPYRDHRSFVMADIPGIIKGASQGKGLGLRFLRHIERNSCLLYMVPADTENIAEEYKVLKEELRLYNPELMAKQHILAISKADLIDDELKTMLLEEMQGHIDNDVEIMFFSSVSNQGLNELKDKLWSILNEK